MRRWSLLSLLLAAAACTPDYPFDRRGTWSIGQYGSANDANLRAMVANPRDLVAGEGEITSLGPEAAPPVQRLFSGRRLPLPAISSTLDVTAIPAQQPAAGGNNAGP